MKYFFATLKHKWLVLLAGLRVKKIPLWRLIIHDWTKFTRHEMPHYNEQFFGDKSNPKGWARAWLHHQNHNPHHWEHWMTRSDHTNGASGAQNGYLEMPETYVREMVADWLAASRGYTGSWDIDAWLKSNIKKIKLHDETWEILGIIFYEANMVSCWRLTHTERHRTIKLVVDIPQNITETIKWLRELPFHDGSGINDDGKLFINFDYKIGAETYYKTKKEVIKRIKANPRE